MTVTSVPALSAGAKAEIERILDRAVHDIAFREMLMADTEAALADASLSSEEIATVSSMRRVALEEWGVDVRRSRAFLRDNGSKVEA